ncbi:MAG: hypothetical protein RSF40_02200 [Oscillospiraceae bacterium]
MSTTTSNLGLVKPVATENVSLSNYNANLDKIDSVMSGWIPLSGTFTYSNATTITTSVNLTSTLSVGMKIRLTNSTDKYGTIKSVTATTIVLNESILVSGTITGVYYSNAYSPFGVAPDKFLAADYIVKYGILNGWEYEKYNSGKITLRTEVIYTPDQKLTQVPGSNIYATPLEIALPFTLTDANYDAKIYGVYCYLMGTKLTDSTASILRYSLYSVFPYTVGLNGTKCTVEVTGRCE